ncbi:MAG: penicillin-binding transpeptidase domain-containing protein [Planctomycetota bacterium]|nr:penicillin-binding transpeptidase domain-containing protein [Planctomycetota bacterium]
MQDSPATDSLREDMHKARGVIQTLIVFGFILVMGRSVQLAWAAEGEQPDAIQVKSAPRSSFELFDRKGQAMALSMECFDISVSPRSLWRSHTPFHMAEGLAQVLDLPTEDVLERLLPKGVDPDTGFLIPDRPKLLRFDSSAAREVQQWLATGSLDPKAEPVPLHGWSWVVLPGRRHATLAWQPEVVLDLQERLRHMSEKAAERPERWTGKLLRDLAKLVTEAGLPEDIQEDMQRLTPYDKRAYLANAIWDELCPTTYRSLAKGVEPNVAHSVAQLLREETVSPWQVQLLPSMRRFQPVREDPLQMVAMGEGEPGTMDPFAVLGHWGVLGQEDAEAQALRDRDKSPHLLPWDQPGDPVLARASELARQWKPWSGLERLCQTILEDSGVGESWSQNSRTYTVRNRRLARDRRVRWPDREVPDYYQDASLADAPLELHTTLDAQLQYELHAELLRVMDRFDPALAMGICVDVDSGRVLAVDGLQAYPGGRFLPTQHVFTPGSTFKAVIMAAALDRGVVAPETEFETFYPAGILVRDGRSSRRIREAEGAPDAPEISATLGLAKSVNAVLVQIGLKLEAADLRALLVEMGYGSRPRVGLGSEGLGYLPQLKKNTWSRTQTHASISFGHELGVTLWQHAQGLATLARGGKFLPLSLVDAAYQGENFHEFDHGGEKQVLSAKACEQVLEMMAVGAEFGTGRRVAHPTMCPEFAYLGTKTGTTEKVKAEVCIHIELQHAAEHRAKNTSCSRACYIGLRGKRDHKSKRVTCYTSSMCAIGRLEEGGPTVLTLIVVDDARTKEKFGADVAGSSAILLLRRALGLSAETGRDLTLSVPQLPEHAFGEYDLPWLEEGDASWQAVEQGTSEND